MRALFPHAPDWLQRADPGYWERARPRALFQRVIENIGSIDRQEDRQRIANLAKRAGLQTPTFQILASVLADFIAEGTRRLQEGALTPPAEIDLGPLCPMRPDAIDADSSAGSEGQKVVNVDTLSAVIRAAVGLDLDALGPSSALQRRTCSPSSVHRACQDPRRA